MSSLDKPVPGLIEEHFFRFVLFQMVLLRNLVDDIGKPGESIDSHDDDIPTPRSLPYRHYPRCVLKKSMVRRLASLDEGSS